MLASFNLEVIDKKIYRVALLKIPQWLYASVVTQKESVAAKRLSVW